MRTYCQWLMVLFLCCAAPAAALATGSGAFRVEVPDAGAVAMGSAFVGEANTPAAVYYNPAGMTQIVGQAVSFGAALIEPHVTWKSNAAPDAEQMKRGDYLIPNIFYVTNLGTKNVALGIGTTTAWGLTTEWNPDSFARYVSTQTTMINHDYIIAVAYKINEQWSTSLGTIIDQSHFGMEHKINQGGGASNDGNAKFSVDDTALGFTLSAIYKLNEQHQFGVTYRSPIHHNYEGKVYLDGLSGAYQAGYHFPGASYETDVKAKMVLPQSIVVGYSFKPDPKWTINADVDWTDWSSVKELAPEYPSETEPFRAGFLSNGYPASKDWHSTFSFAMGTQYDVTDRFRVRGGFYAHQSPIPNDTWDPSIPDSACLGLTTGFGYDFTKQWTMDLAWSGIKYMKRKVNNDVGQSISDAGAINGTYSEWTNLLYATATYKF